LQSQQFRGLTEAATLGGSDGRSQVFQLESFAAATYELFAGMIEFGLSIRLAEIVTVTDTRMERILRRAGWPLRPIGKPRPLGNTIAVAGYLEVSTDALVRIRSAGRISCPVLWAPVMRAAA